jgi:hypothetical protein
MFLMRSVIAMKWVVQVEAAATRGAAGLDRPGGLMAAFSRMLTEHAGSATGDDRHWSAQVVVVEEEPVSPVHTASQAAVYGERLVAGAATAVGLPDWPVVRVEVVPELLGAREVADVLRVTRQRFHEMRSSGQFPAPIARLSNGPVWSRPAVDSFLSGWTRRPGPRPEGTVHYAGADGTTHCLTATADERSGTVWVPVSLAATDPQMLQWITDQLKITSSPLNGTTGAVFRVPRWEWVRRIGEDGTVRPVPAG